MKRSIAASSAKKQARKAKSREVTVECCPMCLETCAKDKLLECAVCEDPGCPACISSYVGKLLCATCAEATEELQEETKAAVAATGDGDNTESTGHVDVSGDGDSDVSNAPLIGADDDDDDPVSEPEEETPVDEEEV
jgi:hypothetical protein